MVDISELTLVREMNKYDIPKYMHGGLIRWITRGVIPGHFLTAILSNDLRKSFEKADDTNVKIVLNYIKFLYNAAPRGCWGSEENFENWSKSFNIAKKLDHEDDDDVGE